MIEREIYKALCGSYAQGLETEYSDHDWKLLVMPTPRDLVEGRQKALCTTMVGGDDYDVHDIRDLPDLLWKANPTYLEVLFPAEYTITPGYEPLMQPLLDMRERIARMNLRYLYNAGIGMYYDRIKKMYKDPGENGYNGKQACHALRGLTMLKEYADNGFTDFADCVKLDCTTRSMLRTIKLGQVEKETVIAMIDSLKDVIVNEYSEKYQNAEPDRTCYDGIQSIIKSNVWETVRKEAWH